MHVDLVRDKAKTFPAGSIPIGTTSLKVWHCGYKTLAQLQELTQLRHLVIATYPDSSFEPLGSLTQLESLRVLHFPRVGSLQPLSKLGGLRTLSLECLPSWDASYRRLVVESLAPLAQLPHLETLHLLGVVPTSRSLTALEASPSLQFIRLHGYPKLEQERYLNGSKVRLASSEA